MTLITNKQMSIKALPFPLSAVFMMHCFYKGHAHQLKACHDFNSYINEKETPKTCLTNHKGSISHHITPLVINSLRGGHTHTHASILTLWTKAISRNQLCAGLWLERAWFNKLCNVLSHLLFMSFRTMHT